MVLVESAPFSDKGIGRRAGAAARESADMCGRIPAYCLRRARAGAGRLHKTLKQSWTRWHAEAEHQSKQEGYHCTKSVSPLMTNFYCVPIKDGTFTWHPFFSSRSAACHLLQLTVLGRGRRLREESRRTVRHEFSLPARNVDFRSFRGSVTRLESGYGPFDPSVNQF